MAKAQTAEKTGREEHGDRPLIDSQSEASLKKLISNGKDRGYITYEELNDALPEEQVSSEEIENFRVTDITKNSVLLKWYKHSVTLKLEE